MALECADATAEMRLSPSAGYTIAPEGLNAAILFTRRVLICRAMDPALPILRRVSSTFPRRNSDFLLPGGEMLAGGYISVDVHRIFEQRFSGIKSAIGPRARVVPKHHSRRNSRVVVWKISEFRRVGSD